MKTTFGYDPSAALFLWQRLGIDFSVTDDQRSLWCVVWNDNGLVVGAVVAEFKADFEAHITAATDDPAAMTRRAMRAFFAALFSRGAALPAGHQVRVVATVEPDNKRCIRILKRIGFKHEGFARRGIDGRRDGVLLALLKEDFRFRRRSVSRETFVRTQPDEVPITA
jgi:ribosomal protein S18 acetylase RimI-like enzyme